MFTTAVIATLSCIVAFFCLMIWAVDRYDLDEDLFNAPLEFIEQIKVAMLLIAAALLVTLGMSITRLGTLFTGVYYE